MFHHNQFHQNRLSFQYIGGQNFPFHIALAVGLVLYRPSRKTQHDMWVY